ncbi:unnamed protein product [Chrysoparadoxa australica]
MGMPGMPVGQPQPSSAQDASNESDGSEEGEDEEEEQDEEEDEEEEQEPSQPSRRLSAEGMKLEAMGGFPAAAAAPGGFGGPAASGFGAGMGMPGMPVGQPQPSSAQDASNESDGSEEGEDEEEEQEPSQPSRRLSAEGMKLEAMGGFRRAAAAPGGSEFGGVQSHPVIAATESRKLSSESMKLEQLALVTCTDWSGALKAAQGAPSMEPAPFAGSINFNNAGVASELPPLNVSADAMKMKSLGALEVEAYSALF